MKIVILTILLLPPLIAAEEATVAAASNFRPALNTIAGVFESTTSHSITIVSGSTGQLYAQIVNGAPYDILLAADQERPSLLEKSGHAVTGSRFTYATGRLALLASGREFRLDGLQQTATQSAIRKFAIANPSLAPYGVAAQEAIRAIGAWETVSDKLVFGENVSQTFTLVVTGNAQVGMVALSSVLAADGGFRSAYLPVPTDFHAPIRQDAVLLVHGADNTAATEFLIFLQSDTARDMMVSLGYGVN